MRAASRAMYKMTLARRATRRSARNRASRPSKAFASSVTRPCSLRRSAPACASSVTAVFASGSSATAHAPKERQHVIVVLRRHRRAPGHPAPDLLVVLVQQRLQPIELPLVQRIQMGTDELLQEEI